MTALTDSRKRSREDESDSFMPLSKRITNLHINSSVSLMQSDNDITDYNMNQQQQSSSDDRSSLHFQNHHNINHSMVAYNQSNAEPNQFSEFSTAVHPSDEQQRQIRQYQQYLNENNASSSNGSSSASNRSDNNLNQVEPYDPELSKEENPFYYNKNKLLYDLYVERMRRHQ